VGPNGSGKSNFLQALLQPSALLTEPDLARIGLGAVLRKGAPKGSVLGIRVEVQAEGWSGVYVNRGDPDRPDTLQEECHVSGPAGHTASYTVSGSRIEVVGMVRPPKRTNPRIYLSSLSGHPDFAPLYEALADQMAFYDFDMGALRMAHFDGGESNRHLHLAGAFLGSAIGRLSREQPRVWERIKEYLHMINPAVEDITIAEAADLRVPVFQPLGLSAQNMSDGTLRALATLVALFQSVDGGPSLSFVGLEEPETAIHPGALAVLLDAMQEASLSVQVAATSHSADLLDNKDIPTESLLAFEEIDGVAHIGAVDAAGRQILKQRLFTPGELMRMGQLHPEFNGQAESEIESILFSPAVVQ
jgi:hypothetical protein